MPESALQAFTATTPLAPTTHSSLIQEQQPAIANLEHLIYILSDSDSDANMSLFLQSGSEYEPESESEPESEFEFEYEFQLQFPHYSLFFLS